MRLKLSSQSVVATRVIPSAIGMTRPHAQVTGDIVCNRRKLPLAESDKTDLLLSQHWATSAIKPENG